MLEVMSFKDLGSLHISPCETVAFVIEDEMCTKVHSEYVKQVQRIIQ